MKTIVFSLLIVAFSFSAQLCLASHPDQDVNVPTFKKLLASTGDKIILDIRTSSEVAHGTIDGALNIDYRARDFKSRINQLDKSKTIFIFCAAGGRSDNTTSQLLEMGFTKIYNLVGGYNMWRAQEEY